MIIAKPESIVYTEALMETLPARTLSGRGAQVLAWLESERRPTVSTSEVTAHFGWSESVVRNVMSRLARGGWLRRTTKGQYETIFAETGGWVAPNPWAALSTWQQRYYVGFQSAAHELGLTPDRPRDVQACVPFGAKRPRSWSDTPISLIFLRSFGDQGTETTKLHGFSVRVATVERILMDAAGLPQRIGGIPGLARVLDRAADRANWEAVVRLSEHASRARAGLRRLAAMLEILGRAVPDELARAATASPGETPFFLGERRIYGAKGKRLPRWQIVVNVDPGILREELSR